MDDAKTQTHGQVRAIRKMGRIRRSLYRRSLVKWLEKHPPNGWLMRDVDRQLTEGRIKWLDEGCP